MWVQYWAANKKETPPLRREQTTKHANKNKLDFKERIHLGLPAALWNMAASVLIVTPTKFTKVHIPGVSHFKAAFWSPFPPFSRSLWVTAFRTIIHRLTDVAVLANIFFILRVLPAIRRIIDRLRRFIICISRP